MSHYYYLFSLLVYFLLFLNLECKSIHCETGNDIKIKIHLRGVYNSKFSLIPFWQNNLNPVAITEGIKNGDSIILTVNTSILPGEFILRCDYIEKPGANIYPSEKKILVNAQNLSIHLHPMYLNNSDSTYFQQDEIENTAYNSFLIESDNQKKIILVLQNLLTKYDDINSVFYSETIKEYEKRRIIYNNWIKRFSNESKAIFAKSLFRFESIPEINWTGSPYDRNISLRNNYFNQIDFNDTHIIKTNILKEWMNNYVNLYGELATTFKLRDSLFTLAGEVAIEKAKMGHPDIYGWMVDYFFSGYESFNLENGIIMLEKYAQDPQCRAKSKEKIIKRNNGIKKIIPGSIAIDIIMNDSEGKLFNILEYKTDKKFLLLLFWSADCNHCKETVVKLKSLENSGNYNKTFQTIAYSVDETETEIIAWKKAILELKTWVHLRAKNGIAAKTPVEYYVVGVPLMFLIDAKSKRIIEIPESVDELLKILEKQ
ncbi:MAG: thioredoxin-like domain-containing protein [Bacteroidales bacterium]